ncbi:hypothetical protein DFQ26_002014, partial [Actinomortierella ambigua]
MVISSHNYLGQEHRGITEKRCSGFGYSAADVPCCIHMMSLWADELSTVRFSRHSWTYRHDITMTCSGYPGAVTRVLKKNAQFKGFEVSLETGKATVESDSLSQIQSGVSCISCWKASP